jgi:hypothetical protein
MPEKLLRELGVHAFRKQQRGAGDSDIIQAYRSEEVVGGC